MFISKSVIFRLSGKWMLVLFIMLVFSQPAFAPFTQGARFRAQADWNSAEPTFTPAVPSSFEHQGSSTIYLPFQIRSMSFWGSNLPIMLGIYSQEWPGSNPVMEAEFVALDQWAGKRLSLAGTFVDFVSDPNINIDLQLTIMRNYAYTPFLNLGTNDKRMTAQYIANGGADDYLRAVAREFAEYTQGGRRMAFVAPLQEMNGSWVPYGLDPENWKRAYLRIKRIFYEEGVPQQSVRWVFAPNGSSPAGYPELEAYYPGDSEVDAVGVSAYNLGYCPFFDPSIQGWHQPEVALGQYLERMETLAPKKMLFLAQTATSSYTRQGMSDFEKDRWLYDAYTYITSFSTLRGVIYYNRWNAECDWSFYQKDGKKYDGYRQAIKSPLYQYVHPDHLLP